jgi:hypothetical protein
MSRDPTVGDPRTEKFQIDGGIYGVFDHIKLIITENSLHNITSAPNFYYGAMIKMLESSNT